MKHLLNGMWHQEGESGIKLHPQKCEFMKNSAVDIKVIPQPDINSFTAYPNKYFL